MASLTDLTQPTSSRARERYALDAIFEIAKGFSDAPDPVERVPDILNILSSFLDLRHGVLAFLADPDTEERVGKVNPYFVAATAFTRQQGEPAEDILPKAVAGPVFRSGIPVVSFDLEGEFGEEAIPVRLRDQGGQTMVAVPLRDPDQSHFVFGVLAAFRSHDDDDGKGMSDLDVRVLTMCASLLKQSLSFRRRIARDRDRALTDARRLLQSVTEKYEDKPQPVSIAGIIGDSPEISGVIAQVRRVAGTKTPVLLRGESGTGKELFARAVHTESSRSKEPFVRVNCAALSETLLESELFGHEKGSFTGANAMKKGRFELADGGTLFLDEIGEISPTFQTKLLRVLQEGEFERVGGTKTIKVDVRIVAATNADLEGAVAKGSFRADLYFRICVVPIVLPPLRARRGDIRPLAQLFLDRFNKDNGTRVKFAENAYDTICKCKFPGNVRELENCVSRAASLSNGQMVLGDDLACKQGACLSSELWRLQEGGSPIGGLSSGEIITPNVRQSGPRTAEPSGDEPVTRRKTSNTTRDDLIAAMEEAGWVQAKAARLLGMTPRQVAYALQKHDIELRRI